MQRVTSNEWFAISQEHGVKSYASLILLSQNYSSDFSISGKTSCMTFLSPWGTSCDYLRSMSLMKPSEIKFWNINMNFGTFSFPLHLLTEKVFQDFTSNFWRLFTLNIILKWSEKCRIWPSMCMLLIFLMCGRFRYFQQLVRA